RSGIREIQHFDTTDLAVRIAGEVPDFDPKQHMDGKLARRMGRFAQFAVAAAGEAITNAGLTITDENRTNIGVMMNTGGGGVPLIEQDTRAYLAKGVRSVSPFLIPLFAPNMASSQVSIAY